MILLLACVTQSSPAFDRDYHASLVGPSSTAQSVSIVIPIEYDHSWGQIRSQGCTPAEFVVSEFGSGMAIRSNEKLKVPVTMVECVVQTERGGRIAYSGTLSLQDTVPAPEDLATPEQIEAAERRAGEQTGSE